MTATTIKVSRELRDLLKAQAASHGRTLGAHLLALAEDEERRERFRRAKAAMAAWPADDDYLTQAADWQSDSWS